MFSTSSWEIISFLIFVVLAYKPIKNQIITSLKNYSQTIKDKLAESTALRQEAEKHIEFYQKEHKRLSEKSKTILENTEENIKLLITNSQTKLDEQIATKKRMHKEKIMIHEKEQIANLKLRAVNQALAILKAYLKDHCNATLTSDKIKTTLQLINHDQIIH
jgi:F0F1-type ATP synthase membrane subunit b/b'